MSVTSDQLALVGASWLPGRVPGESRVEVDRASLPAACSAAMIEPGARLATMIGEDDRTRSGAFRLTYTFALNNAEWLTIESLIPANDPVYPSVTPLVPAAHWYEREVRDLLGVEPQGHPDPRGLVLHDDWPEGVHPLRKDFDPSVPVAKVDRGPFPFHQLHGEGIIEIPVGPIHAGVIEPGHFRFAAVGERILHLEARLFFTHRGIEKLVEGKSVDHALQVAERICGVCSVSHAVSFSQAIETLAGIPVPDRAAALRVLSLELERIYNHVGDLGNICAGIGFAVGASAGARLKDDLQRLNERVTGHRYLRGVVRVGGVRRDLDTAALKDIETTLPSIRQEFEAMMALILGADTATERLQRTGLLSPDIVRALGAVGIAARASGVAIDSRRDHPHGYYRALPPIEVVTREKGDVEARALVRMDEAYASIDLVLALIAALPAGDLAAKVGPIPGGKVGFAVTESPRGENLHWVRTAADGTIDRYRVRSASYPNWPAVAACVPGNMVPDFPVINKSFELCYACNDR